VLVRSSTGGLGEAIARTPPAEAASDGVTVDLSPHPLSH
jgi:hypothetical protein